MTFEEIKDMINSTITENGQRHITGKAINLALTSTVEHLEEVTTEMQNSIDETLPTLEESILVKVNELLASLGGAASEIFYLPDMATGEMDPDLLAHNIEVYNKFKDAFEKGEPLPLLSMDLTIMFAEMEQQLGAPANASGYSPCMMVVFVPADSPLAAQMGDGVTFLSMLGGSDVIQGVIQPDGNVMLMM